MESLGDSPYPNPPANNSVSTQPNVVLLKSPGGYLCMICNISLSITTFKRHMSTKHPNLKWTQSNIKSCDDTEERTGFLCFCGYFSNRKDNYMRHCSSQHHTPNEKRSSQWFYTTGHLVTSKTNPLIHSSISTISNDKVEFALQQWNNIFQELTTKFGIPENLAGRLRNHASVVCDGTTLEHFLLRHDIKMNQPGPMNFIRAAKVWLEQQAEFLLSTVTPKIKSQMMVFNPNTDFETNFSMRHNTPILLDELEKLIWFSWGSQPVSHFQDIFSPLDVSMYLYALVSQATTNNLFTLPVACKFTIYRCFHIKHESIPGSQPSTRFRSASVSSSTAATHLHLLRLGSLCYLATFHGPQYIYYQSEVCK